MTFPLFISLATVTARANDQNRTDDLILTMDVLYRLSYIGLMKSFRAEDGARTRHPQLGRLVLYQMSYFRLLMGLGLYSVFCHSQSPNLLWGEEDSNLRSRKTTDLQSVPFGHSGIPPGKMLRLLESFGLPSDLFHSKNYRADGGTRTPDLLITNQ